MDNNSLAGFYMGRAKIYFVLAVLVFFSHKGFSQQLPLYSQYMMNKFLLNPAVAGSEGYTAFNLTAREQWIGFKNSPKTHALSAQTRVLQNSFVSKGTSIRQKARSRSRSGRVGIGGYIFNDQTGMVSRTGLQLTYAYHIMIRKGQLSFGLSGTVYQFKIDRDKIVLYEDNDELINTFDNSLFIPDADVGVYYSDPRMYAGLSALQLFQSSLKFGKQGYDNYRLKRHYYLMGGYNVDLTDDIILEPNLLVKASEGWSLQMDLGAKMYFMEDYWGGLMFRTGGALILMGGVKIDMFYIGYAFDYTLSSMMKHSFGTHEFMLALKLGDSARRYRWLIRY
jgi:type IX secretion system PorP/SprF family membrane protein